MGNEDLTRVCDAQTSGCGEGVQKVNGVHDLESYVADLDLVDEASVGDEVLEAAGLVLQEEVVALGSGGDPKEPGQAGVEAPFVLFEISFEVFEFLVS